jgi:hypothetical protein
MDLHIQYVDPSRKDICVAFCFFNTCGYIRPLQNLLFFENKLKAAKIPYFSIEMVIGDQPPMLANPTLRVYSKTHLFYKEALWNRLEKEIPEEYSKICFLDSDIIFQRVDWIDNLSRLLDIHDIVHPFHILTYLDMSYKELSDKNISKTMSYIARDTIKNSNIPRSAPGLGWAIRRSFFRKIGGFYDMNMLGSSDNIFCGSIMKKHNVIHSSIYPLIEESANTYFNKINSIEYSVSYLHCETLHLYHGSFTNRKYSQRTSIIRDIKDPWGSVYYKNTDGFWELRDETLNMKFYNYFVERDEDDISNDKTDLSGNQLQILNPLNILYSKPIRTDICVAFVYFNSCGYIRPIQNLLLFENKLRLAGIPYYSAEMVIGDQKPFIVNPTLRFYSKSALFYKEGLWNRLEKEIPSIYTKICFLDSDVIFNRSDWLDGLSEMLDSYDLVHPFEHINLLNESYTLDKSLESSIKRLDHSQNKGGSGYGWAIRRDLFSNIGGFFDMGILGGGDELFYCSLFDVTYDTITDPMFIILNTYFSEYKNRMQSFSPNVTYFESTIYHLFHGLLVNRHYGSRYNIVKELSWDSLFLKNSDGFWESMDTLIITKSLDYFKERQEDSSILSSVIPSAIRPSAIRPSAIRPSAIRPSAIRPSAIPSAIRPSAIPSVIRPLHRHIYNIIHQTPPSNLTTPRIKETSENSLNTVLLLAEANVLSRRLSINNNILHIIEQG